MASTDPSFKDEGMLGSEATKNGVQQLTAFDSLADEMKTTLGEDAINDSKAI